ncbi:hypothetical protein EIN_439920 [Entamoeba invadens IP1]|uniref:Uncharacterized protein n=1 Tax=Entamoeba invadens IP1 TaxID=370355 RepID=A0A0A1TZE0_ENTIV|nr:hypothetical protein EIN_439920 [Entamoeba invadens IP1]ELP83888.1 hypothetical protein EIN_439920 [Entamoeba invadens IP1]|eukprot:XP_004183234.1 hypothetical protein EIN_439920 [Entamoeba invadens IP1]
MGSFHSFPPTPQEKALCIPYKVYRPKIPSDVYILFSHGNGLDMGQCVSVTEKFPDMTQSNIVVYDYSGYGLNPRELSPLNNIEDITAMYLVILKEMKVKPHNIFIIGQIL